MSNREKEIEFEELPRILKHALEILVEWHDVIVYEINKGMYGFYILDKRLPYYPPEPTKASLQKTSEEYNSILDLLNTKFKDMRCKYFYKGELHSVSMKIEITDLCYLEQGYGFSIETHNNDHGFLYGKESESTPAYVHVLDEDELEIGLLSITGPCPKKISDIKEFRPFNLLDYKVPKTTPLMKHRRNLIKWANQQGEFFNKWEWAQEIWATNHGIQCKREGYRIDPKLSKPNR
jgi:hypothetical protein